jgi:hypothetical protein
VLQTNGRIGIVDFEFLQQYNDKFPFSGQPVQSHWDIVQTRVMPRGVCFDAPYRLPVPPPDRREKDWVKIIGMSLGTLMTKYPPTKAG